MPKNCVCPFFLYEKGLRLYCSGGMLRFRDYEERRSFVYVYCASLQNWERCQIAVNLTKTIKRRKGAKSP